MRNIIKKQKRKIKVFLKKIKLILESRWLAYKNRNETFVKERRAICKVCPYSSLNSDKTVKTRIGHMINMGAYCTSCGCSLKYKTAHPESVCGLVEINEKPKWEEYYEI